MKTLVLTLTLLVALSGAVAAQPRNGATRPVGKAVPAQPPAGTTVAPTTQDGATPQTIRAIRAAREITIENRAIAEAISKAQRRP
jgi:hypothetical protein